MDNKDKARDRAIEDHNCPECGHYLISYGYSDGDNILLVCPKCKWQFDSR